MNQHPHLNLSRRERQLMDIVYARGEATTDQVRADLPDPPTRTGVRTMLRLLELKGHLKHRKQGRRYVYIPTHARQPAGRSALRRVLDTFFDGSIESAMAAHLADDAAGLSDEQVERLVKLIYEARKGGTS
jgi:predicted transcriptional regulator